MLRIVIFLFLFLSKFAFAQEKFFNNYILRAVDEINKNRAGLGYGSAAYTQDLPFGKNQRLKATNPPLTMCVAAQVEIISKAFELYFKDTNDTSPYTFLPFQQWSQLQPGSLRGKIWLVDYSGSSGTADALHFFGMGEVIDFDKISPGAFVNLNREKSGHAVVFLGYIDEVGNLLQTYSKDVAGFKYFSSQGKGIGSGFGFRYAFFTKSGCPNLSNDKKRDCGVIYSLNQKYLNTGQMLSPEFWNKKQRDTALSFSKATPKGFQSEFNADYFNGQTTDD